MLQVAWKEVVHGSKQNRELVRITRFWEKLKWLPASRMMFIGINEEHHSERFNWMLKYVQNDRM